MISSAVSFLETTLLSEGRMDLLTSAIPHFMTVGCPRWPACHYLVQCQALVVRSSRRLAQGHLCLCDSELTHTIRR